MHELSLAEGIYHLVEEQRQEQEFTSVLALWLDIGSLTCIELESFTFCLGQVFESHFGQRPEVHINKIAAEATCRACTHRFELHDYYQVCPRCGGIDNMIEGGQESRLTAIDVSE